MTEEGKKKMLLSPIALPCYLLHLYSSPFFFLIPSSLSFSLSLSLSSAYHSGGSRVDYFIKEHEKIKECVGKEGGREGERGEGKESMRELGCRERRGKKRTRLGRVCVCK